MRKLSHLKPEKVFGYFEDICSVPHGSGNTEMLKQYLLDFAEKHSLKAESDDAGNVFIFKDATDGYEDSEPMILQGHIDMVCQKTEECTIDFEKDGLDIYVEDGFIKAKGTTLGADDGIAVALVLAILDDNNISHPAIEAVFTNDEEIGMIGAQAICAEKLHGKKMINLDSEDDAITVSCAGGASFKMTMPYDRESAEGKKIMVTVFGLSGGHSGVDIDKHRHNANILMGRILNHMKSVAEYRVIKIDGGDKGNAIPRKCICEVICGDAEKFLEEFESYTEKVKNEILCVEKDFQASAYAIEDGTFSCIDKCTEEKLLFSLNLIPNGICEMSPQIENLVETSLNLGILRTDEGEISFHSELRSNKSSSLSALCEKMEHFASFIQCNAEVTGHYPPWEYRENSSLREICSQVIEKHKGVKPDIAAIHAGLECGVFASKIKDLDCVSIGAEMYDVHTTEERLSVKSVEQTFDILVDILEKCK